MSSPTEQLPPPLEAAATGPAVLYVADAAHPAHNTRPTRAWPRTGQPRPLPAGSGRERGNLNAALTAHRPTQVHVYETDCANAQSRQVLHEKLLAAHPDGRPVYVVRDNARRYKNRGLAARLADKPLVQVFLPPYSPNPNLVERLWKFLRQKIINATFCRAKGRFRQAVLGCFSRLDEFGPNSRPCLPSSFIDLQDCTAEQQDPVANVQQPP